MTARRPNRKKRASIPLERGRVYFTIVSRNYLSYAVTLMQSLEAADEHARRIVVLVDEPGGFEHLKVPADVILARDLQIATFDDMTLRYGIMELNTAVKPYVFQKLFEQFPESIIFYIDPDIIVLQRLKVVEELLQEKYELALTPHITAPLQDGFMPDDLTIMKSGVWNLGFAAFRRSPSTERHVGWWADRCQTDCRSAVDENIFTDQRWMDLAPCFVERTAIVRDPGYNLAYWNLNHRNVERRDNGLTIEGAPVTFVHFSGIIPNDDRTFSKHQNRFQPDNIGDLKTLFEGYRTRILANDWAGTSKLPYAYGQSKTRRRILDVSRRYFRSQFPNPTTTEELQRAGFAGCLADWTDQPEQSLLGLGPPFLSRVVYQCWTERKDLHAHFAVLTTEGRRGLLSWFANSAKREFGVDDLSLERARRVGLFGPSAGAPQVRWESVAAAHAPMASSNVLNYLSDVLEFQLGDETSARLPRAFALLWEMRRDLQNAFPMSSRDDWQGFVRWCYETGPVEGAFDKHLIERTGRFFRWQSGTDGKSQPTLGFFSAHIRLGYDSSFGEVDDAFTSESSVAALAAYYVFRFTKRHDWPEDFVRPQLVWLCAKDPYVALDLPISRLLVRIYRTRPDLMKAFDISREKGALGLLGWFLMYGYQEYALDERILDAQLRAFLSTARYKSLSNLSCCVWAAQLELVEHRDLANVRDRDAIQAWYNSVGVERFGKLPGLQALSEPPRRVPSIARFACAASGYIGSASGRGEDVRMTKRALEAVGISPLIVDRAQRPSASPFNECDEGQAKVDICIGHFNAESAFLDNTWHRAMGINSRYSIGYWAWELAEYPDEWINAFSFYDEIWASTEFARAAFASKSPRPVRLMPMVVENPEVDHSLTRTHFGLPNDRFLFFFHFDFRSFVQRKNPEAAIRAFLSAFGESPERVGLVIKTLNALHDPAGWERLSALAAADSRIQIVDREFSRVEVTSLIAGCDCYLSLHRSEGFGRGLAEAMLLEKPVIATAYSGNMDFCAPETAFLVDYDLIPVREHEYVGARDQVWADAKVDHAAAIMRTVFKDGARREAVAKGGAAVIARKYSAAAVGAQYAERLNEIVKLFDAPMTNGVGQKVRSDGPVKGRWANLLSLFAEKTSR